MKDGSRKRDIGTRQPEAWGRREGGREGTNGGRREGRRGRKVRPPHRLISNHC